MVRCLIRCLYHLNIPLRFEHIRVRTCASQSEVICWLSEISDQRHIPFSFRSCTYEVEPLTLFFFRTALNLVSPTIPCRRYTDGRFFAAELVIFSGTHRVTPLVAYALITRGMITIVEALIFTSCRSTNDAGFECSNEPPSPNMSALNWSHVLINLRVIADATLCGSCQGTPSDI